MIKWKRKKKRKNPVQTGSRQTLSPWRSNLPTPPHPETKRKRRQGRRNGCRNDLHILLMVYLFDGVVIGRQNGENERRSRVRAPLRDIGRENSKNHRAGKTKVALQRGRWRRRRRRCDGNELWQIGDGHLLIRIRGWVNGGGLVFFRLIRASRWQHRCRMLKAGSGAAALGSQRHLRPPTRRVNTEGKHSPLLVIIKWK